MHVYTKPILVADAVWGAVSLKRLVVHDRSACRGEKCCLHNPTRNGMHAWPLCVRLDRGSPIGGVLTERICPHGVGHPDVDSIAYFERVLKGKYAGWGNTVSDLKRHGCDGCCRP